MCLNLQIIEVCFQVIDLYSTECGIQFFYILLVGEGEHQRDSLPLRVMHVLSPCPFLVFLEHGTQNDALSEEHRNIWVMPELPSHDRWVFWKLL